MEENSVKIPTEYVNITGLSEMKKAFFTYLATKNSYIIIIDNDKE